MKNRDMFDLLFIYIGSLWHIHCNANIASGILNRRSGAHMTIIAPETGIKYRDK